MINLASTANTNTVQYFVARVNELVTAFNSTLTVNSNTTNGNTVVNGSFQAVNLITNVISASATVYSNGTIGPASANLHFTSNAVFSGGLLTTSVGNFAVNTTQILISSPLVYTSVFTANSSALTISVPVAIGGGATVANSTAFYTSVPALFESVQGISIFGGLTVANNTALLTSLPATFSNTAGINVSSGATIANSSTLLVTTPVTLTHNTGINIAGSSFVASNATCTIATPVTVSSAAGINVSGTFNTNSTSTVTTIPLTIGSGVGLNVANTLIANSTVFLTTMPATFSHGSGINVSGSSFIASNTTCTITTPVTLTHNTGINIAGSSFIASNATCTITTPVTLTYGGGGDVTWDGSIFSAPSFGIDTYGWWGLSGSNPLINFDNNDYLYYDRTTNVLQFNVGGSLAFNVGSAGIRSASFSVDSYLYTSLDSGNALINMDNNDYIQYNRTSNHFAFVIGGSTGLTVRSSGVTAPAYAIDSQYYTELASGKPRINVDTGDYMEYVRGDNYFDYIIGGTSGLAIRSTGVTSPGYAVDNQLYTTLNSGNPFINVDSNDYIVYNRSGNYFDFIISSTSRFYVNSSGMGSSGNLVVGNGIYATAGHIHTDNNYGYWSKDTSGNYRVCMLYDSSNDLGVGDSGNTRRMSLKTTYGEVARITEYGSLQINAVHQDDVSSDGTVYSAARSGTSSYSALNNLGNGSCYAAQLNSTGANFATFLYGYDNQVGSISTDGSTTFYNTTSDYRLKTNVQNLTGAVDTLKFLRPIEFDWVANPQIRTAGFLAHEIQDVIPGIVRGEKDAPEMQQVDYSKLIPYLVQAIIELEDRIAVLEA